MTKTRNANKNYTSSLVSLIHKYRLLVFPVAYCNRSHFFNSYNSIFALKFNGDTIVFVDLTKH